jgi:prolipoprotein diacylglyceryltransferase
LGTRHDLGLYEALVALTLLIALLVIDRTRNWSHGMLAGLLLLCYAPARFCMEFMRATDLHNSDPRHFGLTPAQYGTFITFSLGAWMLFSRRGKGRQDISAEVAKDYKDGKIPSPQQRPATDSDANSTAEADPQQS